MNSVGVSDFENCQNLSEVVTNYMTVELEQMISCKVMLNMSLVVSYLCEDLKVHSLEYFNLQDFYSTSPPLSFVDLNIFEFIAGYNHC